MFCSFIEPAGGAKTYAISGRLWALVGARQNAQEQAIEEIGGQHEEPSALTAKQCGTWTGNWYSPRVGGSPCCRTLAKGSQSFVETSAAARPAMASRTRASGRGRTHPAMPARTRPERGQVCDLVTARTVKFLAHAQWAAPQGAGRRDNRDPTVNSRPSCVDWFSAKGVQSQT